MVNRMLLVCNAQRKEDPVSWWLLAKTRSLLGPVQEQIIPSTDQKLQGQFLSWEHQDRVQEGCTGPNVKRPELVSMTLFTKQKEQKS